MRHSSESLATNSWGVASESSSHTWIPFRAMSASNLNTLVQKEAKMYLQCPRESQAIEQALVGWSYLHVSLRCMLDLCTLSISFSAVLRSEPIFWQKLEASCSRVKAGHTEPNPLTYPRGRGWSVTPSEALWSKFCFLALVCRNWRTSTIENQFSPFRVIFLSNPCFLHKNGVILDVSLSISAGTCWLSVDSSSGRCQEMLGMGMTKKECCESGRATVGWTHHDNISSGQLFYWRALAGGAPDCVACQGTVVAMSPQPFTRYRPRKGKWCDVSSLSPTLVFRHPADWSTVLLWNFWKLLSDHFVVLDSEESQDNEQSSQGIYKAKQLRTLHVKFNF